MFVSSLRLGSFNKWLWVKNSSPKRNTGRWTQALKPAVLWWIGALPSLVYFSGDWDVHWGYDLGFDPWPNQNAKKNWLPATRGFVPSVPRGVHLASRCGSCASLAAPWADAGQAQPAETGTTRVSHDQADSPISPCLRSHASILMSRRVYVAKKKRVKDPCHPGIPTGIKCGL